MLLPGKQHLQKMVYDRTRGSHSRVLSTSLLLPLSSSKGLSDIMQDPIGGTCPYSFVAHKRNHAQLSFTSEVFPTVLYSETILWPTINGSPILQQYLLLSASFYRKYPLLIFSVILVLLLTGPSLSHCKCSFNPLCIGTAVANGFLCLIF